MVMGWGRVEGDYICVPIKRKIRIRRKQETEVVTSKGSWA